MLNYKTIGTGQHLVLLHGFGFCGEIFTQLIHNYQARYKITIIDLPGHGSSQSIQGIDNWVVEIIKIIPPNAIILGWSLGGLLAIKIANIIKTKKIILMATTPKFINDSSWQYGIDSHNFQIFSDNIKKNITKGLIRFVSLQGVNKADLKQLKQIINHNQIQQQGLDYALDILLTTDLRDEILQLNDVLVYLGKKDTIVPIKLAKWYQQHNIQVCVLEGGHIPFLNNDFLL